MAPSSRTRRLGFRIFALLGAVAISALISEGVASAAFGISLLRLGRSAPGSRIALLDEERLKAAALTEGYLADHVDPFVGGALKGEWSASILDRGSFKTDRIGLRHRPGPARSESAPRIAVLGDSVAFGFGLRDDETIAAQLESFLAEATADPDRRPSVVTVACPGWSAVNERRFLLDHFDEIRPDLVFCLAVANDLDDGYGADESGHRFNGYSAERGGAAAPSYLTDAFLRRERLAGRSGPELAPVDACYLGASPESSRRFEAMAAAYEDLAERMASVGGRFVPVFLHDMGFARQIAIRFRARRGLEPLTLFDGFRPDDGLPGDPHPNARCARAAAWRLARFAIESGCVPGSDVRRLPPEDPDYASRRFRFDDEGGCHFNLAFERKMAATLAVAAIDFGSGAGINQIYAGIDPDGVVGFDALVVLKYSGASRLVLALDRLDGHRVLYPLDLELSGNGVALGRVTIPRPAAGESLRQELSFPLPEALRETDFLDVGFRPSNWVVDRSTGSSRIASFVLRRIALEP